MKRYAKVAGGAVFSGPVLVLFVLGARGKPQIVPFVVKRIAIDMVNLQLRPLTSHVKPRKSMRQIAAIFNADTVVAANHFASSRRANWTPSSSLHNMSEKTGLRVVMEKFTQAMRCNIGLSHEAALSLIGQRPACVSAHGGLRYFKGVFA